MPHSAMFPGIVEMLCQAASLVYLQLLLPVPMAPAMQASSILGCLLAVAELSCRLPWLSRFRREHSGGSAGRDLQGTVAPCCASIQCVPVITACCC